MYLLIGDWVGPDYCGRRMEEERKEGRKGLSGVGGGYERVSLRAMGMFVRALCFALLFFERKDLERL